MDIRHLKAGADVVLRRVDKYGRYEYQAVKISKVAGRVARIGTYDGVSLTRATGVQTTGPEAGELSRWEAFPPDHPDVTGLPLTQVVPEEQIRFVRAMARLDAADPELTAKTEIGRQIVAAFGKDEDFKAADVPPQHP